MDFQSNESLLDGLLKERGHFLGARSHLPGEYHGNSQHRPLLPEMFLSSSQSKVAGQFSFVMDLLLRSLSPAHSSVSPFFFSACMTWPWPCAPAHQDCEKTAEGECPWENVARQHSGMWQSGQPNHVCKGLHRKTLQLSWTYLSGRFLLNLN